MFSTRTSVLTTSYLFLVIFLCPEVAFGQASLLDTAVLPLPRALRSDATIIKRADDATFITIRQGRNGYFCIADEPGDERFSAVCHPESMMKYVAHMRALTASMEADERDSLIGEAIRNGRLSLPAGAISRYISGALNLSTGVPDSVMIWEEIAVPFASAEKTGLTTINAGEAPWLMRDGEYGAHIMIDYRRVAWSDVVVGQAWR